MPTNFIEVLREKIAPSDLTYDFRKLKVNLETDK